MKKTPVIIDCSMAKGSMTIEFKYDGINWSGIYLSKKQVTQLAEAVKVAQVVTDEEKDSGLEGPLLELKCELIDPEI